MGKKVRPEDLDLTNKRFVTVEINNKIYDMMLCPACEGARCAFCNWNGFVGDFYGGIGEVTLKYFCNPDGRGKHTNRKKKLTPDKIAEIRYLYEVEGLNVRKLSELFSLAYSTIYAVVHHQSCYGRES